MSTYMDEYDKTGWVPTTFEYENGDVYANDTMGRAVEVSRPATEWTTDEKDAFRSCGAVPVSAMVRAPEMTSNTGERE